MSREEKPSVFISERHQNPAIIGKQTKHDKFTWAAIVACITTVLFIILIAMQWMDLQALSMA